MPNWFSKTDLSGFSLQCRCQGLQCMIWDTNSLKLQHVGQVSGSPHIERLWRHSGVDTICTFPLTSLHLSERKWKPHWGFWLLQLSTRRYLHIDRFGGQQGYDSYCGQDSLRRNAVAIMVNKRVWKAVIGCNLKNDRMISVLFQGKPFNIMVFQVYAPISNAEEAAVEWFYEDLQDFLELTPKKDVLFIIGDWNAN